jgi:topoisomerase-4 subunit A
VLNLKAPDKAAALTTVDGEQAAIVGLNRKMVIFKLDQVPEMTRGRGVRLQRYREKGLSDVATFKGADGLTWVDTAGRSFTMTLKELSNWRGNRGDAGRIRPDRFLTNNKFKTVVGGGKSSADEAE